MANRQEFENEGRFDRDRGYENERWASQGRDFGYERQERGNERFPERSGDRGFGPQAGQSGYAGAGNYSGSQGGYSGSQGGYAEPRQGSGRENYGRENFRRENFGNYGNEGPRGTFSGREEWQGNEPARGQHQQGTTATYAADREQGHQYFGGNWGGGMGTYSGVPSGDRGQSNYGQSTHGQGTESGQTGRFFGRGPKSYQRSDERIKEDINERLTQNADVDATEIDVEVKQGEVTLRGTVDNRHEKRIAEDIAENVSGVKDVKNEIRLQSRHSTGNGAQQTTSSASSGSTISSGAQTKTANK